MSIFTGAFSVGVAAISFVLAYIAINVDKRHGYLQFMFLSMSLLFLSINFFILSDVAYDADILRHEKLFLSDKFETPFQTADHVTSVDTVYNRTMVIQPAGDFTYENLELEYDDYIFNESYVWLNVTGTNKAASGWYLVNYQDAYGRDISEVLVIAYYVTLVFSAMFMFYSVILFLNNALTSLASKV